MIRIVPWLLVAAFASSSVYLWRWGEQRGAAEAESRRVAEARELEAAGQIVIERRSSETLHETIRQMQERIPELEVALRAARKAAPRSKPVAVASASTGAIVVPSTPVSPNYPCPRCVLSMGDQVELRVADIVLETHADNRVLVGAGEVWRLDPKPATRIMAGVWQAPLTEVLEASEPPPPWWHSRWFWVGVGTVVGGSLVAIVRR